MARILASVVVSAHVALLAASGPAYSADPPVDAAKIQACIEAGEFAPALEMAQSLDGYSSQRDALMAQIATAQSAAGDRPSALSSAATINDDRVLATTLSTIRSQSAGDSFSASANVPNRIGKTASRAGRFGGNQADFSSVIDLITATVAPTTWEDTGGSGTISEFAGGVMVDAQGVLRPAMKEDRRGELALLRRLAADQQSSNRDLRQSAPLRKISLSRLERQSQLLAAQGLRPTEEMQTLAGLQRIKYVLVYPEQGEIVLAGPAGDWQMDGEGRLVGKESGRPVLRLDDLVVVLRHMMSKPDARFGCNITPTQASLADVKAFIDESNKAPLKPGQRDAWLRHLREKLGRQDIEVYGIDPRTRPGLVLVEADYRMKLVGMGLEPGVLGVPSYLESIEVPPGKAPPPMDVLRWWFTLNYDAVVATQPRDAFELRGQGVQVLSENEMLAANGQQVHTGASDALNSQFAHNFTKHFAELAVKYPIYAELQNMCDMALVGALLRSENLPEKAGWHMLFFGDPQGYEVPLAFAPKSVETVINHRIVNQVNIIVGVSGGVRIDPNALVNRSALKTDDYGALPAERTGAAPKKGDNRAHWWWD